LTAVKFDCFCGNFIAVSTECNRLFLELKKGSDLGRTEDVNIVKINFNKGDDIRSTLAQISHRACLLFIILGLRF